MGRTDARNHPSWPRWCPQQPSSGDAHGSTTEPRHWAARRCVGWEQQRSEQPVCFSLAALGRSCGKNSFKQQSWKGKGWAGGRGEGPRWGRGRRARRGAGKGLGVCGLWGCRDREGDGVPVVASRSPGGQQPGSSSTRVCWCALLCTGPASPACARTPGGVSMAGEGTGPREVPRGTGADSHVFGGGGRPRAAYATACLRASTSAAKSPEHERGESRARTAASSALLLLLRGTVACPQCHGGARVAPVPHGLSLGLGTGSVETGSSGDSARARRSSPWTGPCQRELVAPWQRAHGRGPHGCGDTSAWPGGGPRVPLAVWHTCLVCACSPVCRCTQRARAWPRGFGTGTWPPGATWLFLPPAWL